MNIVPSIASADPLALGAEIDRLGDVDCLHLDIEDGNFIPSITFGMDTIKAISAYSNLALDAHLMVTNPLDYVDGLANCGVESMAAHFEALTFPGSFLGKVHTKGKRAGLALNFKTDVRVLEAYSDQLDYVLLLTNEPDLGGWRFREQSLKSIRLCCGLLPQRVSVWADGSITEQLLPALLDCGLDTAVLGRAIFAAGDPAENFRRMRTLLARNP